MKKKFSICIPVYKNEKNLPITIPYIIQHLDLFQEFDVEIVMVNDGSPDNSYQVMQEFQKQYPDIIRIATLTRNFGQGACTHCCLSMAQGDVVGVIAADMQEPLELFVDMLEEWKQGYKLVIASREARNDKGIGIWFSQALHRFIHKYINERYPVGGFDFLVMDREVLDKYLPLDREDAFGQLKLLWLGYEYKELKYTRREREVGKSGWTLGKNGQAEALYINNKSAAFINCRVLSFQDTLLPGGGYNWFKDCFIAGATDFIWGSGKVVLFEDCQIHAPSGTRAVMQARVRAGYLGYVFLNSRFTVGEGVTNSTLIYQFEPDNLTFLNCTFADVYGPNFVGENKPLTPAVPTVATGCKLYNCKTESGSDIYQSIPATVRNTVLQLSKEQYDQYFGTRETIMSWDGYTDVAWFK